MMKRSVFMQTSSSQVTTSSTDKTEPNVQIHSYTSQSEEKVEQHGDKPPVKVQSQKTQEFHQENQEKPVIHQQTIVKVLNGVSDHKETVKSTSSTPISSPKPTRKSIAPRFVSPLNGKIVDQGADVILDCIVDGYPQPNISWYKNGQDLVPKEDSVIITWKLNHAKLELYNVGVKDAGRYTCKAVNDVGTASSTADIVVKKTIFPPVFGRRLQAQMAKVGERVTMNAEVTGTPDPVVTWYKDGEQVLGAVPGGPFRTKIQGNSYSLIIEKAELEHTGKYTVKAVNSGGEAQCIADFIVIEPEPHKEMQIEPDLHMTTHVVFKDVREEKIEQRDHHHQTKSTKITTEQVELQPHHLEITKPSTTETGTSPISISPLRTSPSLGKPVTTESTTVTESKTTEKHLTITMERTPSPAFQKPTEEIKSTKVEVQIPVHVEKKPVVSSPDKSIEPKEIEIPIVIEREKTEKEDSIAIEESKIIERKEEEEILQPPTEEESQLPVSKEHITENIESESISKKSALDFFMSKLNEKEDEVPKEKPRETEIIPLKTSVKQNVSQFEEIIQETEKPHPPVFSETRPIPVVHIKTKPEDTESKTSISHAEVISRGSPSMFSKKEEYSSFSSSEFRTGSPLPDTHVTEISKFNTFPFHSSSSEFHSEHSSSTRFEKHITQEYVHHSSSLEEFNLQPEPPPEIGYIPKTEVPAKLRLDMPSRVKKLEESHRVLSPVEIPSGAVRIFPTPIRTETPTKENIEPQPKPKVEDKSSSDTKKPTVLPQKKEVVEEELIRKEVVEEVSVERKVHLPGTGEWTYQYPATTVKQSLEEHAPIVPKPWSPQPPPEPLWRPLTPAEKQVLTQDILPPLEHTSVIEQVSKETLHSQTKQLEPSHEASIFRPVSPKPSAEGLAMEKLWAPRRTPEPEIGVIKRPFTPEISEKHTSSFLTTSLQETTSISTHTSTEIKRAASPRPSAEGVAMEKLWTPQKPVEPEPIITKPIPATPHQFEKAMSPMPSMEGLAMDKIWAHKHPDSGLKKTWPPPQTVEGKPVIPWAVKGSFEKSWPPPEPVTQVTETKFHKETTVQQEEIKQPPQTVQPQVPKVQPSVETHIDKSVTVCKKDETKSSSLFTQPPPKIQPPVQTQVEKSTATEYKKEETKSSSLYTQPPPIQHYVAEARVLHSSSLIESQVQSITTTEHLECRDYIEDLHTFTSLHKEPSPPVVEEKTLKPSEAKKVWPPGPKEELILQAPVVSKEIIPRRETPFKQEIYEQIDSETFLEPGPPPEMGFSPAPPPERRQSLVEALEQDLQKEVQKEPSRHIVGAVRTIPPPLPPKEKTIPPPLPPKEKVPEIKPAAPPKKETKKPIVKETPFERFPDLEPFPYKPDDPTPKPARCQPPPTPSRFTKGEFASSDYESDFELAHIPVKWRPYESDTEDFHGYRKVIPPTLKQPRRPKSTEPEPLPPSKFDQPPQFVGPPRPMIDKVQQSKKETKEVKTEVSKITSKVEVKTEKVKKHHHHHHHHTSEPKKKHSPPALKPGSPPIFVQPTPQEEVSQSQEQNKSEPVTSPKAKPDSPKSKSKAVQSEFPESGYMADTDEPRYLRQQTTHKYSHFKHEESSKTTIEETTIVNGRISQQSAQTVQEQQKIEKPIAIKPHSTPKFHHKHLDQKFEKKVVTSTTPSKPKKELQQTVVDASSITRSYKDEHLSNLEPFPFQIDHAAPPTVKRIAGPPPPSPSKFVRGEFRESDYESDYDSRIPAKWRPCDSDADEPSYKPVRPLLTPGGSRIQSRASDVRSPTPPTEFDNPPQFGGPPRPKFEPIDKPAPPKLEEKLRAPEKPQKVFKPKPVIPKPPSPVEMIIATPAVREPVVTLQPGTPPEMAYAPPPQKVGPYQNATQMETSKVMKFAESTEHSHRVVSVQQTTRVIKFGEQEKKSTAPEPKLEPFPFKPEPDRPQQRSGPPPTTPKKFIRGEFRESDYESDYEGIRIKPKWTPGDSDTDDPHYRKVKPPPVARSTSVPGKRSAHVPSPMEFDIEPVAIPSPVVVNVEPKTKTVSTLEYESEQKRLKRVEEMRRRFSDGATTAQKITKCVVPTGEPQVIQPGEPPEFGFVPASASYVASKHMSEMTNTFKSKAQQFVDDIITDVKTVKENGHIEKPKVPTSSPADENDPQAYREESRVAEYGTKHIDPDTGLIYFKYDFGYEFGIVLPGEGNKQGDGTKKPKRVQIDKKRDDDIEVPIIHEKSGSDKKKPTEPQSVADSPQFRPKKFTHSKAVKWEPMSESEMSEAEGDPSQQHKKRFSLPQPPSSVFQKAPHILIPPSSRWDQASPSPLSLSPSLPSLSPRYSGQGPHSLTSGVDSTVSPGGSWQGLSPNRGTRTQGRGSTPTPPSTPSTPGSIHGSVGNLTQPRKPPTFITPLRDIAVVSGQTARFECIVQAEPPPNILWSKNGRIIENSQNYQIHYRNGVCRLTIPQAYPENGGSYTCTATNMLGTIGTTGSLQVPGERRSVRI